MDTNTQPALEQLSMLAQWKAHSEPVHQRGKRWYAVAGTVVVVIAAYGIIADAWSLSIVALLSGGIYVLIKDHEPRRHDMTIYKEGVLFDSAFTRFEDIEGFWIAASPGYHALHLPLRRKGGKEILIQFDENEEDHLRLLLGQCTPELTDRRETILDILSRVCKL